MADLIAEAERDLQTWRAQKSQRIASTPSRSGSIASRRLERASQRSFRTWSSPGPIVNPAPRTELRQHIGQLADMRTRRVMQYNQEVSRQIEEQERSSPPRAPLTPTSPPPTIKDAEAKPVAPPVRVVTVYKETQATRIGIIFHQNPPMELRHEKEPGAALGVPPIVKIIDANGISAHSGLFEGDRLIAINSTAVMSNIQAVQMLREAVGTITFSVMSAVGEQKEAVAADKAATRIQGLQRAKTAKLEVAKIKEEEATKDAEAADIQNMVRSSSSFKFSSKKVKEERERKEASKDEAAAEIQMFAKAHTKKRLSMQVEPSVVEAKAEVAKKVEVKAEAAKKVEAATDGLPEVVPLLSPRLQVLGRLYLQQKTTRQFVSYASWPSKGGKRFSSYAVAKPAVQVKPQPTKPPTVPPQSMLMESSGLGSGAAGSFGQPWIREGATSPSNDDLGFRPLRVAGGEGTRHVEEEESVELPRGPSPIAMKWELAPAAVVVS